ncbi:MAG: hypothetical protein ACFFKA_21745 [Candidatus Thorarchaeota archaeon]
MKPKKTYTIVLGALLLITTINFISIPSCKADTVIPPMFSQELKLNNTYTYNVTQFGGDLNWLGLDWSPKYNTSSNSGGQIKVNYTGFFDKDSKDIYNAFGSPMAYMDVEFLINDLGILVSNHTFYNVSNGEAAFNMLLGYHTFQSGFVIPLNNITGLKKLALAQDSGYFSGVIKIKENENVLLFDFKQDSGFQNTSLIYDKHSGLLVSANTRTLPFTNPLGYKLEIFLTNYTLDLNFPPEQQIPSFPIIIILSILGISSTVIILKLKRRIKFNS